MAEQGRLNHGKDSRFIDLAIDKPMRATLANGETITITLKRGSNKKHKNRVRIVSPEIVKVTKA